MMSSSTEHNLHRYYASYTNRNNGDNNNKNLKQHQWGPAIHSSHRLARKHLHIDVLIKRATISTSDCPSTGTMEPTMSTSTFTSTEKQVLPTLINLQQQSFLPQIQRFPQVHPLHPIHKLLISHKHLLKTNLKQHQWGPAPRHSHRLARKHLQHCCPHQPSNNLHLLLRLLHLQEQWSQQCQPQYLHRKEKQVSSGSPSTSHPQTTHFTQTSPEEKSETTPLRSSTTELPSTSQETSTTLMSSSTEQKSTPVNVHPTGTMEPTMSTSTFTSNGETSTSKTDKSATTLISPTNTRFPQPGNIYNNDVLINRATIYTCYYASYTNRNNGDNNVNPNFTSKGETNTFNSEQSSTTFISTTNTEVSSGSPSTSHPQTTHFTQTSPEDKSETTPMGTSTTPFPSTSQETSTTLLSSSTEQQSTPVTTLVTPTGTMETTMSTPIFTSKGETLNFPSTNCSFKQTSPEQKSETTPMGTSNTQFPSTSQETSTTLMSSSKEQQSPPVTVHPTGTMEPTMSTSTFTSNGETSTSNTDQSATTIISPQIQRVPQVHPLHPSTNYSFHTNIS
ncbi:hypothetical protein F7725_016878 [Dissostichus mawsoni]|uniref:Uncharacterized protein n=1 Tax=Dissostichus mawsoni TaxID=36200 RepID=A0A7J5Z2U3_DISMA|nr:hypothetical protein F7725_016878 [Dissostichus mawsoni]